MRLRLSTSIAGLALGLLLASAGGLSAQAATTGTCKDGTTTTSKTKKGACAKHGGLASWTGPAAAASASTTAPKSSKSAKSSTSEPITCADGSTWTGKTRKGACKGHGGIAKAGAAAAAAPAPAAAPKAAAAPPPSRAAAPTGAAPAGATALCKDGTYSTSKHHEGACSHHGGVSQWLDGSKN